MKVNRNDGCDDSTISDDESDWESISDSSQMLDVPGNDVSETNFLANDDDWETVGEEESNMALQGLGLDKEELEACAYFLK